MQHPAPLTDLLIHKGAAVQAAVESALLDDRLTLLRVGLLHALSSGPRPLSELADYLCCGRSNVTKQVDLLEQQQWVRRRADTKDRRMILAELTEEGRAVRDRSAERLRAWEAELRTRLGRGDAAALEELLGKI